VVAMVDRLVRHDERDGEGGGAEQRAHRGEHRQPDTPPSSTSVALVSHA
jgi:hypothetical protein